MAIAHSSKEEISDEIASLLKRAGLGFSWRSDNRVDWEVIARNCSTQSVYQTDDYVDYQKLYFADLGYNFRDLSLTVKNSNGHAIANVILHLTVFGECMYFSRASLPLEAPIFPDNVSFTERKKISRIIVKMILDVSVRFAFSRLRLSDSLDQGRTTLFHEAALGLGASVNVDYRLIVNLNSPIGEIKSKFRKSYKPLIGKGLRLWDTVVLTSENFDKSIWNEFKNLHYICSGCKLTRSEASWDYQAQSIKIDNSFLCIIRDGNSKILGGGYFLKTTNEAVYAVGAYDRGLTKYPLGHVVQWLAINEMKRLNISKYILGMRSFPGVNDTATDKEISISKFKEGFTDTLEPIFELAFNIS